MLKLFARTAPEIPAFGVGVGVAVEAFHDVRPSQLANFQSDPGLFNARIAAWAEGADAASLESELSLCVQMFLKMLDEPIVAAESLRSADAMPEADLLRLGVAFEEEVQVISLLFLVEVLRESQAVTAQRLFRIALSDRFTPVLSSRLPGPANAIARLFAAALETGVEVNRVKALIRHHRLSPDAADSLHWPWPVRIFTLGRFSVLCDGVPMAFSGKSPRKALELLQLLIAHGGRNVPVRLLMSNLWPEEDGGDMKNLFDNTLHRLRKLMRSVDVLQVSNGKLTLDPSTCWVDAWTFQRLAGAYLEEEVRTPAAQTGELQREALAALRLYSGHFLHSEGDASWILAYRDRIKSRYLRFVRALGRRQEQLGQWELAIDIYERALEVDNLTEGLYRQLMVCHQQLGEHAEVLRVYRRCRELLSIVLGLVPSGHTEAVREASLLASQRSSDS